MRTTDENRLGVVTAKGDAAMVNALGARLGRVDGADTRVAGVTRSSVV
jgi:hypothetical protein